MIHVAGYQVQENYESFILKAKITDKDDWGLIQKLFRDLLSANLSRESSFGYEDDFKEIQVFNYPLNKFFILEWENSKYHIRYQIGKKVIQS